MGLCCDLNLYHVDTVRCCDQHCNMVGWFVLRPQTDQQLFHNSPHSASTPVLSTYPFLHNLSPFTFILPPSHKRGHQVHNAILLAMEAFEAELAEATNPINENLLGAVAMVVDNEGEGEFATK